MAIQPYPRKGDFLDETSLEPHHYIISKEELRNIIIDAIYYANRKSSRAILNIPDTATDKEIEKQYKKEGSKLFAYFVEYCGDPASTAFQCYKRSYRDVAKEQFHNRTLQKERMNSGWRYQAIAKDAAARSKRFITVSDIGTLEADFNAVIRLRNTSDKLTIYVSVKNRSKTMGGQDWPKAIIALETTAINDRNRDGSYICVFGITMEGGKRTIRRQRMTKIPFSNNTEIWKSDFFWPFFTNMKYDDIVKNVLNVLIDTQQNELINYHIPDELIESFGDSCRKNGLLDEDGYFNDALRLVNLFCGCLR